MSVWVAKTSFESDLLRERHEFSEPIKERNDANQGNRFVNRSFAENGLKKIPASVAIEPLACQRVTS